MGHIAHPALLLLQLGIEGTTALQLHPEPANPAGNHHHVEVVAAGVPFQSLGPVLAAGDPDAADQGGVVTDFNEGLPHQQPASIELEQLLRPGVDVADVASLIQQDPAGS